MPTLPWGFSPVNAIKEAVDTVNPFNGDTNYNVFNELGSQTGASPQDAGAQDANNSTMYNGTLYYDPITGQIGGTNMDGSPLSRPQDNANDTLTGGGSAYSQQDMDYLNNQQSLYERLMQSIDSAEASGMQRLTDSETMARNKANTQRGRALEDFGVKRQDTERGQTQALDRVGDNSRTLRNSLMRQLGLGASGGSAFMVADNAVARDASKNRANVQQNFGMNFRDLGTAEKRADEDYVSLLDEIKADRRAKEESFKAGILGQRQQNQQSLAEIAAERARLQGGNPLTASAGYRNNYLSLQNQVDALPSQYRTDVSARDLKVETPQLRDYIVDRASIGGGKSKQTQYSPYSRFLQKDDEERLA